MKEQLFQKIVYACSSDNLYQLTDIKKTVVKWHISIWVYVKKKKGGMNMNEEYEKNQDDKIYIIFNVIILHKNVVQS